MTLYRICFATPLARPILDPTFQGDFGGAEVRAVNFAQSLAKQPEFQVSMVLNSHRRESARSMGQIQVFFDRQPAPIPRTADLESDTLYYWNVLKVVARKLHRSLQKRRTRLSPVRPAALNAIRDVPADVYCVFGVHHYAANVVATARELHKRSLLFLASDTDLDANYMSPTAVRNDYRQLAHMCRFALLNCDKIIAQTESQQRLLLKRFGRESTLIRNPLDLRIPPNTAARPRSDRFVLWVGRADTFSKRADKCFELARLCPTVNYVVILNKRDETVFQRLARQAPANAVVIERVPLAQIETYFRHATALINTSDAEGFPNAFLQAGKYGVPIFSLNVDPDGMLARHQCGFVANGDLEALGRQLVDHWHADACATNKGMSSSIKKYVRDFHDRDARVGELRAALLDLLLKHCTTAEAA